jgi:hypothetical protein
MFGAPECMSKFGTRTFLYCNPLFWMGMTNYFILLYDALIVVVHLLLGKEEKTPGDKYCQPV